MKEKRQEAEPEEVESPFPSQQLFVLGMRLSFFSDAAIFFALEMPTHVK
jgi:hypothetical protein